MTVYQVRKNTKGEVVQVEYVCSRGRPPSKARSAKPRQRNTRSTFCGCGFKITGKLKKREAGEAVQGPRRWYIDTDRCKWTHNHSLVENTALLLYNRQLTEEQKELAESLDAIGTRPCTIFRIITSKWDTNIQKKDLNNLLQKFREADKARGYTKPLESLFRLYGPQDRQDAHGT